MRLIDVDNLKPTKGMFIYQTEDADVIAMEAYRWELIEREAPTVKAIPVEWLERKGMLLTTYGYDFCAGVIRTVIKEWEKENEG